MWHLVTWGQYDFPFLGEYFHIHWLNKYFLFKTLKKTLLKNVIIILLYWGYIVAFTKVLTIYILVKFTPSIIF
jgi:hypothetical protein